MQAGTLVASDVQAFTSRVNVNGIDRAFTKWDISRDIVGDLPDQVVAEAGIKQATGSITWGERPDVTDRQVNPWSPSSGWLPKSGDPVVIYAGDGVTEWVQFVGVIDQTTGDGGLPTSTIVDAFDQLNKPFAFGSMLRVMPPKVAGDAAYRGVGLTALYLADQAMRNAGFFATPPTESNPALSVPCQTSMWPDNGTAGTMLLGASFDGASSHALNYPAPWGWSIGNANCTYAPRLTNTPSTPVQLTVMVAPDHATDAFTLTAAYATDSVKLTVDGNRTAVATISGTEACRIALGSATIVTLLYKNGAVTLKTGTGAIATGAITIAGTAAMSSVVVTAGPGARVAGIQVSHPSAAQEFASLAWTETADVEATYLVGITDALPAVDGTSLSVLDDISKANLIPFWIDETGVLQAVDSYTLRNRTPVQTLTTLDDIRTLAWSDSLLGQRSQVDVSYKMPAIQKSRYDNITLYQGSGETLESAQVLEQFVEPGSDEAWIQPDRALSTAGTDFAAFNSAWGSYSGGVYRADSDGTTTSAGAYITSSLSTVKGDTLKLSITIGALPAGTKALLKTKDLTSYNPDMRNFNLPVIRGFAKVQWADATVTSIYRGQSSAPALVHEAGVWVSRTDDTTVLQRIADFIGQQTSAPAPVITGMRVGYDPRRQLGDVITVSSPYLLGVTLTALIVGIRNSADGAYQQSLTVRIITAASAYTTYDEFAAAWGPGPSYDSFAAAWGAVSTYDNFAANPLGGTP